MSSQGLTIADAAGALGVSERTVRRQIKSGKIKAELVAGRYGEEYRIFDLGEVATIQPLVTRLDTSLDKSLDNDMSTALDKAMDMITALQQEKAELYAQLGYLQAQCRHLEDRVKLLVEAKQPWWRRLLRRQ